MKVKAKNVVFLAIGLATLYVMYHNERFVIDPENPAWQRYESFKWWLLPHACCCLHRFSSRIDCDSALPQRIA